MSETARADGRRGRDGHRVGLADGWTVWRTACLRGAGFPVAMLDALAAPEAAAAVDRLLRREAAAGEAARRALEEGRRALRQTAGDEHKSVRLLCRRLAKGRVPDRRPGDPRLAALLDDAARAAAAAEAAREEAEAGLVAARGRHAEALRGVGRDPLFREALAWQNPKALRDGVDVLLRAPATAHNQAVRRHQQLIVSYLQSYCAKNDSIGFFGPIGWADCVDEGPAIAVRPGPGLVAAREVHFEYWAVDALVQAMAATPGLKPWLAPRLSPLVRLEGTAIHRADGGTIAVSPELALLLGACDGETPAKEIAAGLARGPGAGAPAEDDVYAALERMARDGIVVWTLEVPVAPRPERALRRALERVGDAALRARLSAPLDELESARETVAAARGDAAGLDAAFGALEATFSRLTGRAPVQHQGKVYAGRTLVYEDCRRDAEVAIGPDLRARLGPPLGLILLSARWFTHGLAQGFLREFERVFEQCRGRARGGPVAFAPIRDRFMRGRTGIVPLLRGCGDELRARWASVLAFDPAERRVDLSSAALREAVAAAFAAPRPGWPNARFQSPDVLIAAAGVDDIRAGCYRLVLGELHAGVNAVLHPSLLATHPRPHDLAALRERDVARPEIAPVRPRGDLRGLRTAHHSLAAGDMHLACNDAPSERPRDRVVPIGELVVERTGDGLLVRTCDGGARFHPIEMFQKEIEGWALRNFGLVAPAPHVPRIAIDDLVVHRESWRLPCRGLAFAWEKGESERFIAARRWARAAGLPRWLFLRLPNEQKPVHLDLESPPLVELVARLVRRGADLKGEDAALAVSEMLPTPEEAWLVDREGNRYTSEFRFAAVDPEPWRPD